MVLCVFYRKRVLVALQRMQIISIFLIVLWTLEKLSPTTLWIFFGLVKNAHFIMHWRSCTCTGKWVFLNNKWSFLIGFIFERIISFEKIDHFYLIFVGFAKYIIRIVVSFLKFGLRWWVTLWFNHPPFCVQNAQTFLLFGFCNLTCLQTQFRNSF
jgi:hypothetical protein